ncbi:MAG: DNA polymerase III subunit alpha [Alphaproteobacteria bacterium]|nr:DNA polymerase III subunit alpha [Alphaproteobacteria bacterium]
MSAYAELAVTTNFSFLRGASDPEEFVVRARELGLTGIGIADRNSVAGVVRAFAQIRTFAEEEKERQDHAITRTLPQRIGPALPIKLAVGARLVFSDGTPDILAYPRDRAAWGRLTRLLSLGKLRAGKGECILGLPDLLDHVEGLNLIVVPSARIHAGPLAALLARLKTAARKSVWLAAGMLYRGDDARRLARLADVASGAFVPLIAVNDALYHAPERRALQDVVTCIREHLTLDAAGRRLEANAERHLKPPEEMARLFRDAPRAIQETQRFIERCNFSLEELRKTEYADETRQGFATPQAALVSFAQAGLKRRYGDAVPDKVRHALNEELRLIGELGYAPFFLTVDEIVKFARSRPEPILCQGRGSAANSVICFCLGITDVEPTRIDLLFERFVSAERREPPDIDVDFEHERREEVIQHIYEKYGRERAGLAATVICYRGRSAIREVGKVFGLSADTIAALASTLWGWSSSGVNEKEAHRAGLDSADPRLKRAMAMAQALIGAPRHLSQHVGGFVITRSRLDEVVPIENAAMEDRTVIEWEKDDLETLGLLKVDVLALGMLSCLRRSFAFLQTHYGVARDLSIQDDDEATYRMIQRADTIGVFQIESRAQMSMLPRLRPKEFYDLVIEVAIVRPGPIQGNMVHPYLRRREGLEPVRFPSEEMRGILGKTLGVPLFQEQAMRIAIVGAGFQPGEADRLRRAMATFKRVGTIDRFREKFLGGMAARGHDLKFAADCWSQIEGFGNYGFPESHAASFANLVYASAWVKCHYPDVFAAAILNSQPMGFYATAQLVRDAQEHGVEVRAVDVNASDWDCTLELLGSCRAASLNPRHVSQRDDIHTTRAMRLGFRQIGGFSEEWGRTVEAARGAGFDSVRDLWLRTGLPPQALERLAHADAFGSLGLSRRDALWAVKALRRSGDKDDLPLFAKAAMPELEPDAHLPPMLPGQRVIEDYRHLRLSLNAHPVSFLRADLNARAAVACGRLPEVAPGRRITVAGLVLVRQRPGIGNVIFMTLEDETGIANTIVWTRVFERFRPTVLGARLIAVAGVVQNEKGVIHIVAERFDNLTPLLRRLSDDGPRIDPSSPTDEVKRPVQGSWRRHPRDGDALVTMLRRKPADTAIAEQTAQVMPKGRNFH